MLQVPQVGQLLDWFLKSNCGNIPLTLGDDKMTNEEVILFHTYVLYLKCFEDLCWYILNNVY